MEEDNRNLYKNKKKEQKCDLALMLILMHDENEIAAWHRGIFNGKN